MSEIDKCFEVFTAAAEECLMGNVALESAFATAKFNSAMILPDFFCKQRLERRVAYSLFSSY
jgi:hypothetical protein